jgi:beta-glucosidase
MKQTRTGYILLSVLVVSFICFSACTKTEPQLNKSSVKRVIAAMTLEEKAMLVVGTGSFFEMPDLPDSILAAFPRREEPEMDSAYKAMVDNIRKLVPGAAGRTAEISRLGIPATVLADGPAGLRISPTRRNDTKTYYCTAFPIATLLASSWDTELVYDVGEAMGNEVLEYGADVILGPGMNIHRNPLCGRNFEYYSEDPVITGEMAAAMVNGIQSQGVGTSVKHFAANNQETNRNIVNTIVSERALREIYLEGFRIAVEEAQPWTVMSSYNKINGPYTSESHDLLTKILREDWGFEGYVMTDWGGGSDPVAQMKAGNDLLMPGNQEQIKQITKAVEEGELDEDILDKNVERILNIIIKTPKFKDYEYSDNPDLKAHAEVARQAGADGMILLKNQEEALPLTENIKTIAAFGNTSYEIITGGTGSGDVNEAYSISLVDGLENAGYSVDESLQNDYTSYMEEVRAKQPRRRFFFMGPAPIPEMEINTATIRNMANDNDVALITIGRNSGEGSDRTAEPGDFYLTDTEKSLIQNVTQEFQSKGKKAVVILNIGGVIEVASWRDFPDAILLAWQPGQETGNAIADVISGKVNPSGKLASTFPISYDDVPSANNFPGIETPDTAVREPREGQRRQFRRRIIDAEVVYEEDIYVGYRYYSTFNIPVAYEFGYGLSYTGFEYSNIQLNSTVFDDQMTVSVDITNTGSVAGREVIQVYLSAPAQKLDKPVIELVTFGKTNLLDPGESQTMSFVIDQADLASFDEASSSWVAEAGEYEIKIGASSKDIRQTANFELGEELVVKEVNQALEPEKEINRLRP